MSENEYTWGLIYKGFGWIGFGVEIAIPGWNRIISI
jgi:hypothetical protein